MFYKKKSILVISFILILILNISSIFAQETEGRIYNNVVDGGKLVKVEFEGGYVEIERGETKFLFYNGIRYEIKYTARNSRGEYIKRRFANPAGGFEIDRYGEEMKAIVEEVEQNNNIVNRVRIWTNSEILAGAQPYITDPLSVSADERQQYQNTEGIEISESGWRNTYERLKDRKQKVELLEDQIKKETDSGLKKKLEESLTAARKDLKDAENLVLSRPEDEVGAAILAMTDEQRSTFLDTYNKDQCSGKFFESLCTLFNRKNLKEIALNSYYKEVKKLEEKTITYTNSEAKKIKDEKDRKEDEYLKCINSKDPVEKCRSLKNEIDELNKELDDYHNIELANIAYYDLPSEMQKDSNINSKCLNKEIGLECIDSVKNFNCKEDKLCEDKKKEAEALFNAGYKQTKVQSTFFDNILAPILRPDQAALRAARFFGVEPNYKNVPQWLGESFPSQICMYKIDGYLDDEQINSGGGTTGYSFDSNQSSLEPIYDMRAQRTPITPENKTTISYSYFLRAPDDKGLQYTVVVSYVQKRAKKIKVIPGIKSVEKEKTVSDSTFIDLQINATEKDIKSFHIYLRVLEEGAERSQIYTLTSAPVILIRRGEYHEVGAVEEEETITEEIGNRDGNLEAKESQADVLTEDDFKRGI